MRKLIFVYNAERGLFNSLTDFAHKIISPSSYDCRLCAITYGNFTVKKEWKTFIEKLNIKSEFLYRDEFFKKFQIDYQMKPPFVFFQMDKNLSLLISDEEIRACKDVDDLKMVLISKLPIE